MLKKLLKQFNYGQRGFTLIELLVVVAILGVLAAIAIPNVTKFIGHGKSEASSTELTDVSTAVAAAMVDANVTTISSPGTLSASSDITVAPGYTVGDYIQGKNTILHGTYSVTSEGQVSQISYP